MLRVLAGLLSSLAVGGPGPEASADRVPRPDLGRNARLELLRGRDRPGFEPRALVPLADGGYRYADPEGRFSARIEPDGSLHLGPGPTVGGGGVCAIGYCFGAAGITRTGPEEGLGPDLTPRGRADHAVREIEGVSTMLVTLGGRFGPPLPSTRAASEFSRASATMRLEMARELVRGRMVAALVALESQLQAILSDKRRPWAKRRQILFQRWDECEELVPGLEGQEFAGETDGLRREAGARARSRIEQFIRRHLPVGSARAFTPEEIRSMNARRRSRAPFLPYAAASPGK